MLITLVGEENSRVGSEYKEAWNMVCCEVKGLLPADDIAPHSAGSPLSLGLDDFYNYTKIRLN